MVFDAAPIYVSIAVSSLVGLALYFICRLRGDDAESSAILLAEEKQQAAERKARENLATRLAPRSIRVQEAHLKFVIQCCDIECSCCSSKSVEGPNKDDVNEIDLSYSPRLMLPIGDSEYGGAYEEKCGKCIICIEDYSTGEIVVGSNNRHCPHVFHFDCIVTWLVSKSTSDSEHYDCPMCRQLFIVDD